LLPLVKTKQFSLLIVLGLGACIQAPNPPPIEEPSRPDAGPAIVPPIRPEPFFVNLRTLLDPAPDRSFGLTDGALITQTGTTVRYAPSIGRDWVLIDYSFASITAVESLPWGAVLFWTVDGFLIWSDGQVEVSPISEVVAGSAQGSLLVAPGPNGKKDLWIAATNALYLWREEQLSQIRLDDLPTQNAHLAYGAPWQGQAALWLASGSTVYALISTGTVTRAHASLRGFSMDSITVDFEGTVWGLSEGRVLSRSWDNQWTEHTGLGRISGIAGHRDSNQLWIKTEEQGVWSHRQGTFQPIEWEDRSLSLRGVETSTRSFFALPQGQAVLQTAQACFALTPGRLVDLDGLQEGQLLTATTTVVVQFSDSQLVDNITVFLNEEAIEVDQARASFVLKPEALTEGTHRLRIEVDYTDGVTPTRLHRSFSVYRRTLPTWSGDILPLFQQKCEVCHGIRGSARLLNEQQLWRSEIERILAALRSGKMPLPPDLPVPAPEIEKIEGWRAGGYLE
jgi:hypothetical protein